MESQEIGDTTIPESPITSLPVHSDSAVLSEGNGIDSSSSRMVTPNNVSVTINDIETSRQAGIKPPDSGYSSVSDLSAGTRSVSGTGKPALPTSDHQKHREGDGEGFVSPVRPILGVQQTGDGERPTPMFFIKPVNADGAGLTGPAGERLEDKGRSLRMINISGV